METKKTIQIYFIIFFSSYFFSTHCLFSNTGNGSQEYQESVKLPVVIRKGKKKLLAIEKKELTGLKNKEYLEGRYFKVMNSTSKTPISLKIPKRKETNFSLEEYGKFKLQRKDLLLSAATVYYHANKARDHFVKHYPELQKIKELDKEPLILRVNMDHAYSRRILYSRRKEYNNVVSISAYDSENTRIDQVVLSKGSITDRIKRAFDYSYSKETEKYTVYIPYWKEQIWFAPMKKRPHPYYKEYKKLSNSFGSTIIDTSLQIGIRKTITDLFRDKLGLATLHSFLYEIGFSYLFFYAAQKVLLRGLENSYLDTAKIPDIIYHEFVHYALSDQISIGGSTPLNEGLANYFAAEILGSSKIGRTGSGAQGKKYGSAYLSVKNGSQKPNFKLENELHSSSNPHNVFVFTLFWDIRGGVFKERETLFSNMILNMVKEINKRHKNPESIQRDLLETLNIACDAEPQCFEHDKIRILNVFEERGL